MSGLNGSKTKMLDCLARSNVLLICDRMSAEDVSGRTPALVFARLPSDMNGGLAERDSGCMT